MYCLKKCQLDVYSAVFIASLIMALSGFVYDWILGEVACMICVLQRVILLTLAVFAKAQYDKGLLGTAFVGLLLTFRHVYIVMFPHHIKGCLPLSMIWDFPWSQKFTLLKDWVQHLGSSCNQDVAITTYVLVTVLLCYYVAILYVFINKCRKNGIKLCK